MIVALALLLSQVSTPPTPRGTEWVVRGVIPPGNEYPGYERWWEVAKSPSDMDGDDRSDFVLHYKDNSLSGGYPWLGLHAVLKSANSTVSIRRDRYGSNQYSYGSWISDVAMLNSPLGVLHSVLHLQGGWRHCTVKPDGSVLALAPRAYQAVFRIPDLDGDGFDDLFAQGLVNQYTAAFRLDGRTMAEVWSSIGGDDTGQCLLSPYGTRMHADVNWDGVPDFLSCDPVWNGSSVEGEFRMLSGADGSVIWARVEPGFSGAMSAAIVPDVTGDGVDEFAISTSATWSIPTVHFQVVDGTSGVAIWKRYTAGLAIAPPEPGFSITMLENPVFAMDTPGHPSRFQCIVGATLRPSTGGHDQQRFLHLELESGRILGWAEEPKDLEPWYPDPFETYYYNHPSPIGDLDRDGLQEVAISIRAYSLDLPGYSGFPWHMVILGLRTLFQPASAHPGDEISYRVAIPSAPDHDYSLLLSLGFDRDGGARVDGLKTHLVADAAFQATASGLFPGRLDAQGVAVQDVRLPSNPALAGKTLYAKAVVWKPGGAQEVWTMSSLGITEIR